MAKMPGGIATGPRVPSSITAHSSLRGQTAAARATGGGDHRGVSTRAHERASIALGIGLEGRTWPGILCVGRPGECIRDGISPTYARLSLPAPKPVIAHQLLEGDRWGDGTARGKEETNTYGR